MKIVEIQIKNIISCDIEIVKNTQVCTFKS